MADEHLFAARSEPEGVYDQGLKDFKGSNAETEDTLTHLDFSENVVAKTQAWKSGTNSTSRFYCTEESLTELTVTIFGEVLDESEGTALGATGGSTASPEVSTVLLVTTSHSY